MSSEPSTKQAALTPNPAIGPTSPTRAPPAAGPTVPAKRSNTPCSPVARSSGTRLSPAASGIMTSFARSPGLRTVPMTATRASKAPNDSMPSACSRVSSKAATALTTSALQEIRRGPTWSTSGPTKALTAT